MSSGPKCLRIRAAHPRAMRTYARALQSSTGVVERRVQLADQCTRYVRFISAFSGMAEARTSLGSYRKVGKRPRQPYERHPSVTNPRPRTYSSQLNKELFTCARCVTDRFTGEVRRSKTVVGIVLIGRVDLQAGTSGAAQAVALLYVTIASANAR